MTLHITDKEVSYVYNGKAHTCCCGCAGKYTYTQVDREAASKNRGYEVSDDEVNDKRVIRVIRKMQALVNSGEATRVYVSPVYASVETATRMYTAYYR